MRELKFSEQISQIDAKLNIFGQLMNVVHLPKLACRWRILFSSSELCEEDEGSTSETPESAGLGGSEPEKIGKTS